MELTYKEVYHMNPVQARKRTSCGEVWHRRAVSQ